MGNFDDIFARIEELLQLMIDTPEDDRVMVYRRIDPLFLRMEGALKKSPDPCVEEKFLELKHYVGMMARLDDQDGSGDDRSCCCAREALGELRGGACFR